MSKLAYIFPGQGSQFVGMGKELVQQYKQAEKIFSLADQTLGYQLSTLCFEGPEEELKLTYHTQPAILTTSIALYEIFKQEAPQPDYVAGHSLGEYSALVAAEALNFRDAVHIVRQRGQYMDEAVPAGQGAMSAILGGERDIIAQICEEVTLAGNSVQIANLNAPGQIVISGSKEGVEKASSQLKEAGVRRIIPLVVSGPFHSDLMKPAASKLAHELGKINISTAKIPVVTNVDASPLLLNDELEQSLIEQVFSPVLWQDSIEWMLKQGVQTFVEIGPGQVLSGLVKKIAKEKGEHVHIYSVQEQESLHNTIAALRENTAI